MAIAALKRMMRNGRLRLRRWRALGRIGQGAIEQEASLDDELERSSFVGSASRQQKLRAVAEILACSLSDAAKLIFERALAGAPNRPLSDYLLPKLELESCERLDDDLLILKLKNGRVFFGQRANQKEYLLHQIFSGHLPTKIDGDAYKLAMDVERRYYGTALPWYCKGGGTFVEGGCFTGMKAIRWRDLSSKPLRILAVEIGRKNFEILSANVRENGLLSSIVPVHAGLWHESGEGIQHHNFSTRRFLQTTDRWEDHMRHEERVRLLTLDDLLSEHSVEVADYVNIQVNGAEIHVLEGLKDLSRVKVLGIAAYYSQDGKRNADKIKEMLLTRSCTIIAESGRGRITAVTPKFRDEVMALKPRSPERQRL